MSAVPDTLAGADPYRMGHHAAAGRDEATGHGDHGPASRQLVAAYGFWIFLLSDIVMFSCFFAAHAVLQQQTAGGPGARELFEPSRVAIETGCLLLSSYTCGLSAVATRLRSRLWTEVWLLATGLLGAAFLWLEIAEFRHMIEMGAGPGRSAFLSSFFALVGCHGLHVTAGLLWLGTMMAQVVAKGFRADILRRLVAFNLFWHALDIIWVALLTLVYLIGIAR